MFYTGEGFTKKFYPKTVTVDRPGVRVTVREKRLELEFSSVSGCGKIFPMIVGLLYQTMAVKSNEVGLLYSGTEHHTSHCSFSVSICKSTDDVTYSAEAGLCLSL